MPLVRKVKKCERFQIYQDPKERRVEMAEELSLLRAKLEPQVITANSDYSLYYWEDIIASCAGGPYLWSNGDRCTSSACPEFVLHFLAAISPCPDPADVDIGNSLRDSNSFQPQSPCRLFLCSGIARHSSWVKALNHEENIMTSEHESLYGQFIGRSIEYLKMVEEETRLQDFGEHIDLEKRLTQVSFKAWPSLFDTSFNSNAELIREIDRKIPSFARFEGIPCMRRASNIRQWKRDIQFFEKTTYTYIRNNWIYLNAQVSALETDDCRRATFDELQASVVRRWLEACIAGNKVIIKLVINTTKEYNDSSFERQEDLIAFLRSEIVELLEDRWFKVESFLENFGQFFEVEDWYDERWIEIRGLNRERREYLAASWEGLLEEEQIMEEEEEESNVFGDPMNDVENQHYNLRTDS